MHPCVSQVAVFLSQLNILYIMFYGVVALIGLSGYGLCVFESFLDWRDR